MAEKVRIYQLAKELDIESKEMLAILDEMGVDYKSHSSSLDEETADAVRQLAAEGRDSGDAPSEPEAAADTEPAATDEPATDEPNSNL